jgi:hypothetical protein
MRDLTGHKITDRKRGATLHATKKWIANTQKVDRRPARGSLASPGWTFGALQGRLMFRPGPSNNAPTARAFLQGNCEDRANFLH